MKKVGTAQKGKIKVPKMFFHDKMQQQRVQWMQLQVKLQKTAEITYLEENKEQTKTA